MNDFEQMASGIFMTVKKMVNDSYYYGRHPEDTRKELEALENKLAVLLHQQYKKGRQDAMKDAISVATKNGLGGKK